MTDSNATTGQIELFYSYSHHDEKLRDELEKHLSVLQRKGDIHQWHDRRISAGSDWAGQIHGSLDSAQIVLLLVSADFLASDYCVDIEMQRAMERHQDGKARVIPVILRPCDWCGTIFGKLQPLPEDGKPITKWSDHDEAFLDVAKGIRQVAEELRRVQQPTAVSSGVRVEAKGLLPYGTEDASFFLKLLPLPHPDGLPRCVQFWKIRIEQRNADKAFKIGLLFGPSGSGKSSLVQAGLIPNLDASAVLTICVDAAPDDTERRLCSMLRKQIPSLPDDGSLEDLLATVVRTGRPKENKVLLVLDQFEEWLESHQTEQDAPLVGALKVCDGENLQCLLIVRQESYSAVWRMAEELRIELHSDRNQACLDFFDAKHARKVLTEFGRSYGQLPDSTTQLSDGQNEFLERAVKELADDHGMVVAVRLALFAEMFKGKDWTLQTLDDLGGAVGVEQSFLEANFCRKNAHYRRHKKAAMAILQALLPGSATDVQGRLIPESHLRQAGFLTKSEFARVVPILASELKLITRTDPDELADEKLPAEAVSGHCFRLTHDYLVSSIRVWLRDGLQESWRGRARLRLKECAADWQRSNKPSSLPGVLEFLRILLGVPLRKMSSEERTVMKASY